MNYLDLLGLPRLTQAESDAMAFGVVVGVSLGMLLAAFLNCLKSPPPPEKHE